MSKNIKTWNNDIKVGIWESEWTLRLYDDKAILHMPYVKWVNNSGSLAERTTRFDATSGPRIFAAIKKIAAREKEDGEDYTEEIKELIWDF